MTTLFCTTNFVLKIEPKTCLFLVFFCANLNQFSYLYIHFSKININNIFYVVLFVISMLMYSHIRTGNLAKTNDRRFQTRTFHGEDEVRVAVST